MKGSKFFTLLLCAVLCVSLLSACGEQAAEEPALTQPTTEATQHQGLPENNVEEEELPAVIVPQQTQPVTDTTGETEPSAETKPTEGNKPTEPLKETKPSQPQKEAQPTEVSRPSRPTQPTETEPSEPTEPETTQPETTQPETTQPETTPPEATEPTEPPGLDEDELPPVPLF